MNSTTDALREVPIAVDDARRVREEIAAQHGVDLRAHREEANRIFEELRGKLVSQPAKRIGNV